MFHFALQTYSKGEDNKKTSQQTLITKIFRSVFRNSPLVNVIVANKDTYTRLYSYSSVQNKENVQQYYVNR